MKTFPKYLALALAASVFTLAINTSHAQTTWLAVSISGTGAANPSGASSTPAGTGLVGIEFTLNQNIDLTELGFYAQSIGGGDTPHVALLDVTAGQTQPPTVLFDTGNLNTVAYFPTGMTNEAMNYVSVGTPILLTTGKTYEITAPIYFAEQFGQSSVAGSGTAGFTYGGAIATISFLQGGGWNGWDPTNSNPTSFYTYTAQTTQTTDVNISDDFQYTTIPEPSTYAMLGFGGLGMWVFIRRKKSRIFS